MLRLRVGEVAEEGHHQRTGTPLFVHGIGDGGVVDAEANDEVLESGTEELRCMDDGHELLELDVREGLHFR